LLKKVSTSIHLSEKSATRPVADSPRFDTKLVVHRDSQTLLAANVALRCLYRDMPEKELDLLELAAGVMAESRTGASKIVWRKTWNIHTRGRLLDSKRDPPVSNCDRAWSIVASGASNSFTAASFSFSSGRLRT